jgi:hypothetical protein
MVALLSEFEYLEKSTVWLVSFRPKAKRLAFLQVKQNVAKLREYSVES